MRWSAREHPVCWLNWTLFPNKHTENYLNHFRSVMSSKYGSSTAQKISNTSKLPFPTIWSIISPLIPQSTPKSTQNWWKIHCQMWCPHAKTWQPNKKTTSTRRWWLLSKNMQKPFTMSRVRTPSWPNKSAWLSIISMIGLSISQG